MFYDRKVKYFDYKKDGERLRGAGFAKMEVRNDSCRLLLQISGLHMTDTFSRQVYLLSKDREELLCNIELQGGRGMVQKQLSADNMCNGLPYEELQAIRIPVAAGYELYCQIADKKEQASSWTHAEPEVVTENVVSETNISAVEPIPALMAASVVEETTDIPAVDVAEENADITAVDAAEENVDMPELETDLKIMLANKWEQLSAIYPHINPFEDDREYIKLGPEDFVVLSQRSYQLAHNSFLLHGYYNYKHLILARHEWRNEARYYIGVPGNFYEREKQVALMFGFESFECEAEPAVNGTYGYYMIRVDL